MNWLLSAGIQMNAEFIEAARPVAISFLTFHVLAYIIDIFIARGLFRLGCWISSSV
jgi:hypothetical protein